MTDIVKKDGPEDSDNETKALVDALTSGGGALSLAENFNNFFSYVGREASRTREQTYTQPFKFIYSDLEAFDKSIKKLLADFEVEGKVLFDCDIGLRNRRVVSFQDPQEAKELPDTDKSYPERLSATWTYFYNINWKNISVPVPYRIQLSYYTNPRKDFVGAMTFAMAPEQLIFCEIQGPHRLIQSINDEIDGLVQSTYVPLWWRIPKRILQYMEPYIGFAIYGAVISTVLIVFNNYEELTGKSLFSDKTDKELRKEIIESREEYFKRLEEFNTKKSDLINKIVSEPDTGRKIDMYVEYQLEPTEAKKFKPIDEIFDDGTILPYIGYLFLAFTIAGIFHMAVLEVYKRLTPPSVIAIGRLGLKRLTLYKFYDWIAITLLGAAVAPLLIAIGASIKAFFS